MKVPRFLKPLAFAVLRALPPLERRVLASAGYRRITPEEAERLLATGSGWKSARSARRQQAAYDHLLKDLAAGRPRQDLVVAGAAVDAAGLDRPDVLEVGCGGGYHAAVFAALSRSQPDYVGSDFSAEMVDGARRRFPDVRFEVADATCLPYADASFDIVFEGVSLMHIPAWQRAIGEIARVARSHVIFHSVPLFAEHRTEHLFKYAYGEPVVETIYGQAEFAQAVADVGLVVEQTWLALNYDVFPVVGHHSRSMTYLCRKRHVQADMIAR